MVTRRKSLAKPAEKRTEPRTTFVRDPEADGDLGDGWYAYKVTQPINVGQLTSELNERLGVGPDAPVTFSVYGTTDTASPEEPVALHWNPPEHSDLDPDVLTEVGSHHTADPTWQPDGPTFAAVVAKNERGETLTPEELQVAVSQLLRVYEAKHKVDLD